MILQGYSGSELGLLVYKQGKKASAQKEKHRYFSEKNFESFKVPLLFPYGEEYLYSYIDGCDALSVLLKEEIDYEKLANKIVSVIKELAKEKQCFLDSLCYNTSAECIFNKLVANGIDWKLSGKISSIINLPVTLSHGDLTFDNILLVNNSCDDVYLIDFLPLFYPSYFLDIAKLFQDIDGNWTQIRYNKEFPKKAKNIIREIIWDSLPEEYKVQHNALMVVSFARILPYAKNEHDRNMIKKEIEKFLEKIN
jgi:thiamine kinase-like enzyme